MFILAGVVIAGRIYESSHGGSNLIQAQDWGYALLLWVYLTVSRLQLRASRHITLTSWLTRGKTLSAHVKRSTGTGQSQGQCLLEMGSLITRFLR